MISLWMNEAFARTGLPIAGSDVASRWDSLYSFLVWMSVFFFVLVIGAMLVFIVKYKDGPGKKSAYITDNHLLEALWTLIPLVLVMVIFVWGWVIYKDQVTAPADAMEVRVVGKQWLWQFQYEDGRVTVGEVYVPAHKPVKFIMSSDDVLHSFFIPAFRVKQDVVPGMYTSIWFEANVEGFHQIFCTEYCGTSHSGMLANLYALGPKDWEDFQAGKKIKLDTLPGVTPAAAGAPPLNLADQGRQTFATKGCTACHSVDGSKMTGPTLKGVFGSKVELVDGKTVTADENYIRESIEMPNATVVKGFTPVMPPYKGLLQEDDLNGLVAYIKSLK